LQYYVNPPTEGQGKKFRDQGFLKMVGKYNEMSRGNPQQKGKKNAGGKTGRGTSGVGKTVQRYQHRVNSEVWVVGKKQGRHEGGTAYVEALLP